MDSSKKLKAELAQLKEANLKAMADFQKYKSKALRIKEKPDRKEASMVVKKGPVWRPKQSRSV